MGIQPETTDMRAVVAVTCAFCSGTGTDPFGLMSPLSVCQVCGGLGKHLLAEPIGRCAFCRGSGVHPHTRMTCTACRGIGSGSMTLHSQVCPGCRGSGQESDHEFPDSVLACSACRGKGMIPA